MQGTLGEPRPRFAWRHELTGRHQQTGGQRLRWFDEGCFQRIGKVGNEVCWFGGVRDVDMRFWWSRTRRGQRIGADGVAKQIGLVGLWGGLRSGGLEFDKRLGGLSRPGCGRGAGGWLERIDCWFSGCGLGGEGFAIGGEPGVAFRDTRGDRGG